MREALVNCRPMNMQPNSAANSAPAARPPRQVARAGQIGSPRQRIHASSSTVAPAERAADCSSGGISASVSLIATCPRPQTAQQVSSSATARASR